MEIDDLHGLRLTVSTHATNQHGVTPAQLSFAFYMPEAKPENLVGDRGYAGGLPDKQLCREGIAIIAPQRKNRNRRKAQDCRRLRPGVGLTAIKYAESIRRCAAVSLSS